jgi:endonuclease/exonuclease/phosphatase family metal-dependent hydrolase
MNADKMNRTPKARKNPHLRSSAPIGVHLRFSFLLGETMRRIRDFLTSLVLLLALGAPALAQTDEPVELRVMIFNIWLGGDQVNLGRTFDAIRAADPDILLLQEAEGRTREFAEALGWPYAMERRHIISKYPLFDPPAADADYALAEIRPGRFVAVANIHLTAEPYGPYAVREGKTAEEVLTIETETRLPEIEVYIAQLTPLAAGGVPAIIGGDFNAPSHLDWTAATAAARPQVRFPLEWPVNKALADAGFRDSYRDIHPDSVAKPGITWTSGYPVPHILPDEAVDRIDQIHALGNATTVASQLIGETGGPDIDIGISPWPSDHHALVSAFSAVPGPAPAIVSIERRAVTIGEPLAVRFHAATEDGRIEDGRVLVVAPGSAPSAAILSMPTNNGTDRNSLVYFGTVQLKPGAYDTVLVDAAGVELARAPFWMLSPGAMPEVDVDSTSYADNEAITVTWKNAPGHRRDWLGIYKAGDPDQLNYLAFAYTGATIEGTAAFDEATIGGPLDAGDYEVRLMRDDAYMTLAVSRPFSVSTPP